MAKKNEPLQSPVENIIQQTNTKKETHNIRSVRNTWRPYTRDKHITSSKAQRDKCNEKKTKTKKREDEEEQQQPPPMKN